MSDRRARRAYYQQTQHCASKTDAAGNSVRMLLTFDEWFRIWQDSGHWHERGRMRGQYVMSRVDDLGDYAVGNVFIQQTEKNLAESNTRNSTGRSQPWASQFNLATKSKPCTIDGVTIFPSRREMCRTIGSSKFTGANSPGFRYV